MDESISTFCAFTGATPEQAQRYLQLTENNVEQAVELYFTSPDLGNTASAPPTSSTAPPPQGNNPDAPINIDDDDDVDVNDFNDDEVEETHSRPAQGQTFEDDEAMARRLQQEMYGGADGSGADADGIRAPMARTTETLVGPSAGDWRDDPSEMNTAIAHQLMERERERRRRRNNAPGIFNQSGSPSIWNDDASDPETRRQNLSRATGGASDQTPKASHLAELFRPPFDLIAPFSWQEARDEGKDSEKWILVNVQDPSIFDCQVLNRDIWKNASIRDTVKEHFIFLQYSKDDPRGAEYVNYYFSNLRDQEDAYPYIAIVDPRTGEQVKTWSGSPSPKASDFLMDLHEFLDRYSLKMERKNPVQTKRKEVKKDVAAMSEEEMLELALQASMNNGGSGTGNGQRHEDPDSLTKSNGKGKEPVTDANDDDSMDIDSTPQTEATPSKPAADTPFSRIPSTSPHVEPDGPGSTRIQFKYSGGRIVRKWLPTDPVRRIYEWLKAEPLDGQKEFELLDASSKKNLIDSLDLTIAEAGLKQATVMIEFVDAADD